MNLAPSDNDRRPEKSNPPVSNQSPARLRYRCRCGSEIVITAELEKCPECGQRLPRSLGNDPTMTMSFCSLPLDATTDIPAGASNSTPVRGNTSKVARPSRTNLTQRTGQRLGHFVLQEPLGEGGMGSVYRALDSSLQRYVAVKVLRDGGEGSSGTTSKYTDRLRQEAVSQARLNHPRVVTIYYVGREDEEPFLAMELLPGPTLQERLEDGPLPYDELIEYAMQMTDALEAADQSGMVHGDIKPSNLLMAGAGSIKLSDFGLARRSGSSSDDGSVSGTPNYIAPELLDGEAPNIRTDMYALGVTFFELAFGRRPFELSGDTLREQLMTHRTAEIQFPQKWPADIPEPFRDVLQRLLAKNPANRYGTYAELRRDLQSVCPIGSTLSGIPARVIAWVVDQMWVGLMQIPVLIFLGVLSMGLLTAENEWVSSNVGYGPVKFFFKILETILQFGLFLAPAAALWWELKRFRTPGRYLMQIRVVDKYGLPPSRRAVAIRNGLRFLMVWGGVTMSILAHLGIYGITAAAFGMCFLWLLVDFIPVLGSRRRAIHDIICDTHVVLDERSVHQKTAKVSPGTMIHSY